MATQNLTGWHFELVRTESLQGAAIFQKILTFLVGLLLFALEISHVEVVLKNGYRVLLAIVGVCHELLDDSFGHGISFSQLRGAGVFHDEDQK
jgi:hypothetical protein